MTTVLFDLDGTLLPMDQDIFVKDYFSRLAKKMASFGYEPNTLVNNIWKGTGAMVMNDGKTTNEKVFWSVLEKIYGPKIVADIPVFEEFYAREFQEVAGVCGYTPKAKQVVTSCKAKGYQTILATNPIFPAIATESRMRWAGLEPSDFEYYTTYEHQRHSKPNPAYYKDIVEHMGLKPEEYLMVGNDVTEDMVAESLGMKVFLLTDCLINKEAVDISRYPNGNFDTLLEYLENMN
ncbi:MAG: HAD family hydrolase [Clostridia bacterium]|nr:HAD family hydrolase [Lachnospiraceae bacterium]NCB99200.1 HAD family hydrolase [Clostridia bacterium]NCD03372.1 HAD family hydrolase [Clostridia bacterium]